MRDDCVLYISYDDDILEAFKLPRMMVMSAVCCVKGCDLPVIAGGLCVNHWRMNKKHGSPVAERPLSAANRGLSVEERFWKSVRKTVSCWIWTASRDKDGYGIFRGGIGGAITTRAHRYSYIAATGHVLESSALVMHTCDNPSCVNPDHLVAGTPRQNTQDMIDKGRNVLGALSRSAKIAKLSDDQVIAILRDPRHYAAIADDYGIHKQHVQELKSRASRAGVEIAESEIVRSQRGARGEERSTKLTEADVLAIRDSKDRNKDLAARYGLSPASIVDIQKRRSWRHI